MEFSHRDHTADCMNDSAEDFRKSMTPQTIEANHRLHMGDVWYAIGKDNRRKRPTPLPVDSYEWCGFLQGLDEKFGTLIANPHHHRHTCPMHTRSPYFPNRDDYNAHRGF